MLFRSSYNRTLVGDDSSYVIDLKVGRSFGEPQRASSAGRGKEYKNEGRSNLAIPAPVLDCAAKSIRLHGSIGLREREPCGSRNLFRPRRKVFRPCGSIEI